MSTEQRAMNDKPQTVSIQYSPLAVHRSLLIAHCFLKMCAFGALFGISLIVAGGCSYQAARVSPPSIPADAGQKAVAQFDRDLDGAISGTELDAVPSLKSALRRFDRNRDGKVTAEEINARITDWRDSKIGLLQTSVTVLQDGQPLPGAEITLIPETFLGSALHPATGITSQTGLASLKISDDPRGGGVQLGFYRISISKKSDGQEAIAPRYNTATELGVEIARDNSTVREDWILTLQSN